jgi:hypothetical protein
VAVTYPTVRAAVAYPNVGDVWHLGTSVREVLEVDPSGHGGHGRVRWKNAKKTRWCKASTWRRWCKDATEGRPPEGGDDPAPLFQDLGERDGGLWGVLAPIAWVPGKDRDAWRSVVAECAARGASSKRTIEATGLTSGVVNTLTKELREGFLTLGPGVYAARRERLWFEARELEAATLEHLAAMVPGDTDAREVAALVKVLLESQKHRAQLCGATDAPTTAVTVNVGATVDPVAIAVQRFGLDPGALADLGDGLAGALTDKAREVIEAEFEDVA